MAIIVVTHDSANDVPGLAQTVAPLLRDDDELLLVDNASTDGTPEAARAALPGAKVIETGRNLGFAAGCHAGADASDAPLLLFLNPDCRPRPDCLERLRAAAVEHPDWAASQAVVLLDDDRINTSGNVVHYLGIGWAGDCDQPLNGVRAGDREVAFPSGAAMLVRREDWLALGGMDSDYFMYGEDLDFGLRLWLSGRRAGVVWEARVLHGYEFEKGSYKWFYLERNRWRTILSVYPGPLLALLAPALLAAELALIAVAARGGWLGAKLRANVAVLRELPGTLARRRAVQATRTVSAARFAQVLTASLDSPYLPIAETRWLSVPQTLYWRLVVRVLSFGKAG
jgi:N-acetylglucosaminyl-diphospho-decaprenol L-rhamnosyltransferase